MATVLLYNLTDADRRRAVKLCLFRLGLRGRDVATEEFGLPLGALLGLEAAEAAEPFEPFSDEMLVMHELSRQQFSALLEALRRSRVLIALKAVVTPTNVGWSSVRLHRELQAEHAAMLAGAKKIH